MATPSRVFAGIAALFGVDKDDEQAVLLFFEDVAPTFTNDVQSVILEELLAGDGLPEVSEQPYIPGAQLTKVALSMLNSQKQPMAHTAM